MIDEALFNIVSYGRRSPGHGRSLTIGHIKQITRTVRRTPEVMVKVINKGSSNLAAVGRHVDYIGRKGEVELETDDGEILRGKQGRRWRLRIGYASTFPTLPVFV